jgi:hypothetical protein
LVFAVCRSKEKPRTWQSLSFQREFIENAEKHAEIPKKLNLFACFSLKIGAFPQRVRPGGYGFPGDLGRVLGCVAAKIYSEREAGAVARGCRDHATASATRRPA